jgi:hypothetical protein
VDNGWESSTYHIYPVIVFASNGSRYAIDEYFTESAFSKLIDAIEELAERFENLYGSYFEEEALPEYGGY